MNRAEAIPVDGSRSTTEPPSGHVPAVPPPAPGHTVPARPGGGGNTLVVPALTPHRGPRRPENTPDRLPVRRAEPALPEPWEPALPEPWTDPSADVRGTGTAVTRRTGRRRGAIAARRVVGL
ncbi:hypothetical protein [Actinoplanes xinjiangensis]|nr:hypothetical protein [Actinoplanes xinjiangensis]GIF36678.1 hypothetical protein Axi01nite_09890 [Actinoplanes xinjiangensis]